MSHKRNNSDYFFSQGPVDIEIRAMSNGTEHYVFGYAALYNSPSREMYSPKGKKFVERIAPGAFDGCDFSDVKCQFDHTLYLASVPTLQIGLDDRGLWYRYRHDDQDPDHVSVYRKIARQDVKGSSFMFSAPDEMDQKVEVVGGVVIRTINKIRTVWDVGPVVTPAYPATTTFARSLDAAYDTNINPTPAQKEAGNYKKGRVRVSGMEISIENPMGSYRRGVSPEGEEWATLMRAHYGYILGSKAGDGDNLDVFLTETAREVNHVFVVDQVRPDGTFDEHKVLIGPKNQDEARNTYLAHYPDGWRGLGALSFVPMACFKSWAFDGRVKRVPLSYVAGDTAEMRAAVSDNPTPEDQLFPPEAPTSDLDLGELVPGGAAEAGGSEPEAPGSEAEAAGSKPEEQAEAPQFPGGEAQAVKIRIEQRKIEMRQFLAVRVYQ